MYPSIQARGEISVGTAVFQPDEDPAPLTEAILAIDSGAALREVDDSGVKVLSFAVVGTSSLNAVRNLLYPRL